MFGVKKLKEKSKKKSQIRAHVPTTLYVSATLERERER